MSIRKSLSALLLIIWCFMAENALAQKELMANLISENFAFANSQYRILMKNISPNMMPQSLDTEKDNVSSYEINGWCSGFYAGCLWYIYEQTYDEDIRREAERALQLLTPNETNKNTHDLGFMMNCSFGNGYRLTHDSTYKNILFTSAASLSTRFKPIIGAIQSWNNDENPSSCPVIIDNMMNLELLNWVSCNGGSSGFKKLAIAHTNTTTKNHFRLDYSSYHVVDYDLNTGKVLKRRTAQGYSDSSAWARGQAWALYGYTSMYRYTRDPKYLDQAKHIANFILNNPKLPADRIPYWDFDAPDIPHTVRDASAAAIMCSALLELGQYTDENTKKFLIDNATIVLKSLSSSAYRVRPGEKKGFLLLHSTGGYLSKTEVDTSIIYADYYFLEALKRYKDWYL